MGILKRAHGLIRSHSLGTITEFSKQTLRKRIQQQQAEALQLDEVSSDIKGILPPEIEKAPEEEEEERK